MGALEQDRHSGILGVLGDDSNDMVPVTVRVRSFNEDDGHPLGKSKTSTTMCSCSRSGRRFLMMATLANSIFGFNDYPRRNAHTG